MPSVHHQRHRIRMPRSASRCRRHLNRRITSHRRRRLHIYARLSGRCRLCRRRRHRHRRRIRRDRWRCVESGRVNRSVGSAAGHGPRHGLAAPVVDDRGKLLLGRGRHPGISRLIGINVSRSRTHRHRHHRRRLAAAVPCESAASCHHQQFSQSQQRTERDAPPPTASKISASATRPSNSSEKNPHQRNGHQPTRRHPKSATLRRSHRRVIRRKTAPASRPPPIRSLAPAIRPSRQNRHRHRSRPRSRHKRRRTETATRQRRQIRARKTHRAGERPSAHWSR